MGKESAIAWTDHTFNPWWGCAKVSPACTNCYAATFDHRLGGDHWGPKSERRFFGDAHWNEPRKWNRAAERSGKRAKVFCASMADVFEDRADLLPHRARLFELIRQTPNLDWLLLTKRPENLPEMIPWCMDGSRVPWPNVWLGTTTENQEYLDERGPHLLEIPAYVHFLSMEPLLGRVDLTEYIDIAAAPCGAESWQLVTWVIAGCESGHDARPQNVDDFRALRDQCDAHGVAFFLKQATELPATANVVEQIGVGRGSWRKAGGVIELPYLDGVQHAAFPEV